MNQPPDWSEEALIGPALRTFAGIANAWSLTKLEQSGILGHPVDAAFSVEQTGIAEELWPETLERVSYAIGIYRTLHSIFPDRQQADTWIRRPNSAELFNGAPALVLMCSGRIGDLASVRKYLETAALGSP